MAKYNYKNCQSLFGYSADVHIKCKGKCQLCGCGGEPPDFDLWRQMTVEHLIGKSQGGYLKQVREEVKEQFPHYSEEEVESLSKEIDSINTVTACQFCNSTTSRDISYISMNEIIKESAPEPGATLENVRKACEEILARKKQSVQWKLESVRDAFDKHIASKIIHS